MVKIRYLTPITCWFRQKLSINNINVFYILFLYAIINIFISHGKYNYKHIPTENIESYLFKEIHPNIIANVNITGCDYQSVMHNPRSLEPWNVPRKFEFSIDGVGDGSFTPEYCNPVFSVALIVPYRNRQSQLDIFLPYMHLFLRRQNIHFKIYLVEQQDDKPFNRGLLFNVGAKHALLDNFPCLILHDVDLIPLDESNLYACLTMPRHMSSSVDKFRYVLTYDSIVGGALAIRADQFTLINGFSNRFKGWGGEDDDLSDRIRWNKLEVMRFPRNMSRYTMLVHKHEPINKSRWRVMQEKQQGEGFSTLKYVSAELKEFKLFTLVAVKLQ